MKIILDLSFIGNFFNSPSFSGVATLFTAFIAYLIFLKQKIEKKSNAALILLNDVLTIERAIDTLKDWLKDEKYIGETIQIVEINNWKKYSYLFTNDFKINDLMILNNFFYEAERLQKSLDKNESLFWINAEEKTKVIQRQIMIEIVKLNESNLLNLNNIKETINDNLRLRAYDRTSVLFNPNKPLFDTKNFINKTSKLSGTTIYEKLRNISEDRKHWYFLWIF